MTGLIVLDTFISLVFIFLLYSLFTMTLIESLTSIFSSRAKNLLAGIERLLADEGESNKTNHTIVNLFYASSNSLLTNAFYQHPSIRYLGPKGINSKPSYISPDRFSTTLVDLLKKGTNSNQVENISAALGIIPTFDLSELEESIKDLEIDIKELRSIETISEFEIESAKQELSYLKMELDNRLKSVNPFLPKNFTLGKDTKYQFNLLWNEAGDDIEKFKGLIEQWYNEQMERISGWYKRKLSLLTFILGFIIACSFKVDTIQLAMDLSKNEDMRAIYVEGAKDMMANNSNLDNVKLEANKQYFDEKLQENNLVFSVTDISFNTIEFLNWVGFLITAFAISLGAPFWFDMLSKLMRVRNSLQPSGSASSSTTTSSVRNNTKAVG
ncbi:hypothetical protein LV84_02053 [Algoriphagus ratkowskyi]|uniref:Uncharacterized protein n=1 Tax=Algoriphagus ratkowskyi TaxID=57028 RepID=A0A2W7R933_9BACT|nr:hypothetical protein [Algoriphagus ratkowskyi]PZX56924.1 hypothetical protein LV84_02053 [Algoriphagus ratkowskyi]TXD79836.1 hypothetical protein ESW18_01515 [Algoriphagus ratkowskyi]